ncbi:MAG: bifunctional riboflavin kinase/FAD synthetase [Culturomica sp.]|jgi:riboflavin kinase/FMN adenylyltransferase|nr:bifunctional riboflavin kinase/FAD synthetase [Culturomica sp.]
MNVYFGLDDIRITNPVVTIGSFDGVHSGHAKVLRNLYESAVQQPSGESVIITFEPHPREVLYPLEKPVGLLTTLNEKIELLSSYKIDNLIILPFTKELAAMPYTDFVKTVLVDKIGVKTLVVGYDHHFGKNREGNYDVLKESAQLYGFRLKQENAYMENAVNVSSTKIRKALELGDVPTVNKLLGYRYIISGEVVHGEKIGSSIGFPTANIQVAERKLLPATGVYAVEVHINGKNYAGIMNIGTRPTVSTSGVQTIEVHILDFADDIYGKEISVSLIARIRGERKFDNKEELQSQLHEDIKHLYYILN